MLSTFASAIKPKGLCLQSIQQTPTSWTRIIDRRGLLSSFIHNQSFATTKQQTKEATTDIKTRKPRQSWSIEETREMSKLISSGMRVKEIHQHFPHRNLQAVQRYKTLIQCATELVTNEPRPLLSHDEKEKSDALIEQEKLLKEIEEKFPGRLHSLKSAWSAEEDEQLRELMRLNISPMKFYQYFPRRKLCAIRRRISELNLIQAAATLLQEQLGQPGQRQQQLQGSHGVQNPIKLTVGDGHGGERIEISSFESGASPRKNRPWTPEEDETLKKMAANHEDLSKLWRKIDAAYFNGGKVDGVTFIRTGPSSKKRLEQLKIESGIRTGIWDSEEIKKLKQAVQEQIGDEFQVMVDVRHDAGVISAETAEQDKKPGLKLNGPELRKIDWNKVVEQVGSRDRRQCRDQLLRNLHNGVRGPWSPEELERMKEGVKMFENDWMSIAAYVGTRSPSQAAIRWSRVKAQQRAASIQ